MSGRISNHGFSDYDRLQRGSPSPVSALDVMPDFGVKALYNWNGNGWSNIQQEVSSDILSARLKYAMYAYTLYVFIIEDCYVICLLGSLMVQWYKQ